MIEKSAGTGIDRAAAEAPQKLENLVTALVELREEYRRKQQ